MLPKRMRISKSATDTLKLLKARTGLTPNIVCRMALILSLEQGKRGGESHPEQDGSEFNATTLFGEFAVAFEALLTQVHGKLDAKTSSVVIASHVDSGLEVLRKSRTLLELIEHSLPRSLQALGATA
jgi:DNA sulfur modification protein DndE